MIHPGYGFLSERIDFVKAVLDAGFIWVGPPPNAIQQLGDKMPVRKLLNQLVLHWYRHSTTTTV